MVAPLDLEWLHQECEHIHSGVILCGDFLHRAVVSSCRRANCWSSDDGGRQLPFFFLPAEQPKGRQCSYATTFVGNFNMCLSFLGSGSDDTSGLVPASTLLVHGGQSRDDKGLDYNFFSFSESFV